VHTRFNINKDGADKTCPICFEDFQENEDVIPLPCNEKHIFHDNCITEWLKNNNACPLCKKPIDENGLRQQRRNVEQRV
jgi:E3 ubiquitin-protein ligase DOA10